MNDGLVFFTIHSEENSSNGGWNPRSALVVEALQRRGCAAVVLGSPKPVVLAVGGMALALFDISCGVNRWSPRSNTALRTPDWARALSSGSCVAIGQRCVRSPTIIERAAAQIATLFLREFSRSEGQEYPWGPAPAPNRKSRRGGNIRPYPRLQSHLTR